MVTLYVQIIPYTLLFIGAEKTSGINTSMLLLSEIVFTLLFTPFIGEKTTVEKLVGALGVSCGAALLLYRGSFQINTGDILIILSTATYPVGNFYAKKALSRVSSTIILLVRFSVAAPFFFLLSMLADERLSGIGSIISGSWPLLLFTGFVLLGVGKIVWYEALDRLDISKAISLSMTFPLFSLMLLTLFYGEVISWQQGIGIGVMMVGAFFFSQKAFGGPERNKVLQLTLRRCLTKIPLFY